MVVIRSAQRTVANQLPHDAVLAQHDRRLPIIDIANLITFLDNIETRSLDSLLGFAQIVLPQLY